MRIVWSPLSLDRAEEAARYIAERRATAATRWIDELFHAVDRSREFPFSGRMVPEFERDDLRELIVDSVRVVCRIEDTRVLILTVRPTGSLASVPSWR
ncbi:MAG: type II toxin-antitoxin system RelE/ParE family toxin [Gemmatimonadales bacterium]